MRQFNGAFGCPYCLHEGEEVPVGNGFTRVYCGDIAEKRTLKTHNQHIISATETCSVYKGVKGGSIVQNIPNFSVIHSLPPEYMHCGVLGVINLFLSEWFKSSNCNEEWYLGRKKQEFNEKLLLIKPCREITKTPILIEKLSNYTANDLLYFGLYYSVPCLSGLLPTKYLKHWFLYTYSLYIFSKTRFNDEEYQKASKALTSFVLECESLYRKDFMKFNVHCLLHIPECIKRFGALWAWSAYPFEHFNGIIRKLYHGTQCVPTQVCKQYKRLHYVKNNSSIFGKEDCDSRVQQTFTKIMRYIQVKNCIDYDCLKIFGKGRKINLSSTCKLLIEQVFSCDINITAYSYQRFIYDKVVYHSNQYQRMTNRDNSIAMVSCGEIFSINEIVKVLLLPSLIEEFIILGRKFNILPNETIVTYNEWSFKEISNICELTENIVSYKPNNLISKCIKVPYEYNKCCIYCLPNSYERD